MCVGGALPRAGDRGNRREGREGRGEQKEEGRKDGRISKVEKRTDGGEARERRYEPGRTGGRTRNSHSLSLSLLLCGPECQKRKRHNDPLCRWSASMVLRALWARSKRYIV